MKKKHLIPIVILITFGIWSLKNCLFFHYYNLERIEFEIGDMDIDDFAYWLDDIDIDDIKNSKYDLIIMDYSRDGSSSGEFTRTEVDEMKSSGNEKKILISYISIGEAEDYRYYWNNTWDVNSDGLPDANAPDWLDIENPDWEGNYKVKYWDSGWQKVVYNYLDKIMNAYFDGIYLDLIDAYEYYASKILNSDLLMIDFVVNISTYVKTIKGNDFVVFVQNGDELLQNSHYLNHIDGIGREDLFFDDNEETEESDREDAIDNLNEALEEDKSVLIIDYTSEYKYDFYKNCIDNGFLPYAAERDLDCLNDYYLYSAT